MDITEALIYITGAESPSAPRVFPTLLHQGELIPLGIICLTVTCLDKKKDHNSHG